MDDEQRTTPRSSAQLARGTLIGLGFSVLGLYAVLRITGGHGSWAELVQIEPMTLAMASGLMLLTRLIDSLRMKLLSHSLGGKLRILDGIRISILGTFASNVTFFGSAGGPMQIYFLTCSGLTVGQSTALVATKSLCSTFGRLTLGLVASIWLFCFVDTWILPRAMHIVLRVGIILYFAGLALFLYLIMHPDKIRVLIAPLIRNRLTLRFFKSEKLDAILQWIDQELREFHSALQTFTRSERSTLWKVTMLSYAWWITLTTVPAVILLGLGMQPRFIQVMAVALIFYLAASYAPTPGSSGAAELGFAALFSSIVPHDLIGLFVGTWRVFTYFLNLLAGGVLIAMGIIRRSTLPAD